MNSYTDRLHALFQLEFFGMKLGLENITKLLEFLDRPERKFPSAHIAGTNGKGSVSAMLAAVHQSAGKRTGLYTSPHLIDFRERIRIDGEMISENEVTQFLENIWPKVEELRATFFEVTTAMAFDHFARHGVDVAIIETGLGGRLDATNVLERPLATVVTSIGFDHIAQLGPTLESIASEKAGIFKHGVPSVVNCDESLKPLFQNAAENVGSEILFVRDWKPSIESSKIESSLAGPHQKENLRTVLATLSVLPDQPALRAIQEGIKNVGEVTGLRARLEEIVAPEFTERGVCVFLDVGHNPQALNAIKEYFEGEGIRPIVVFGIMRDKDVQSALEILGKFAKQIVAVQAETPRVLTSPELHEQAITMGLNSSDEGSVMDGVAAASKLANSGDTVLIAGSHYVVGEFLENFHQTGVVTSSRE